MEQHSIPWSGIENGFRGFEHLAVDFVQSREKTQNNWQHTQETHDNNHDARTIILGYHSDENSDTEWWMEAKYSQNKLRLSRYRLDATIVSAILHGNVEKVIFVTNIDIGTKAVIDIQKALLESTTCKETIFYTQKHLEYWLMEDYKRVQKYFPSISHEKFSKLTSPELVAIEFPEFYPAHSIFREPITLLYSGHFYLCYFTLFSARKKSIVLMCDNKDLYFNNPKKKTRKSLLLEVEAGLNPIEIEVYINPQLKNGESNKAICFHLDKNVNLFPEYAISVADSRGAFLEIKSQQSIESELYTSWKLFKSGSESICFHRITGTSGSGKSYMVQRFLDKIYHDRSRFFLATFNEYDINNSKVLIHLIFHLLFPFLPPQELDDTYIGSLNILHDKQNILSQLLKGAENIDDFLRFIKEPNFLHILFPIISEGRPRAILLDDVHKLQREQASFLFSLLKLIKSQGYSLFVIMIGQTTNSNGWNGYSTLKENILIKDYYSRIEYKDLLAYVQPMDIGLTSTSVENLFGSVIEFLYFLKYTYLLKSKIQTANQFWFAYHSFKNVKIFQEYVLSQFQTLFLENSQNSVIQDLCIFIYYSPEILTSEDLVAYRNELQVLYSYGVMKIDASGNVVPYHDIYKELFLRVYEPQLKNVLQINLTQASKMRWSIMTHLDNEVISSHLLEIENLLEKQHFYTVYHILEYIFQNVENIDRYNRVCSQDTFCRLYWNYAYAATNVGKSQSGNSIFSKVCEIAQGSDTTITAIRALARFELLNGYYEHLDFENAESQRSSFTDDVQLLPKSEMYVYKNKVDYSMLASSSITILIQIERGNPYNDDVTTMPEYIKLINSEEFKIKFRFERLRIALALLGHNFELSWKIIEECKAIDQPDENDKASLMINFAYSYLQCAIKKQGCLADVRKMHNTLKKNYNNDYRRHLPAMAFLYFTQGLISEGDAALFELLDSKRIQLRQQAICAICEATSVYLKRQTNNLSSLLEKFEVARGILGKLPTYSKVIDHNTTFISKHILLYEKIDFFYGQELDSEKYYIDSRFIY